MSEVSFDRASSDYDPSNSDRHILPVDIDYLDIYYLHTYSKTNCSTAYQDKTGRSRRRAVFHFPRHSRNIFAEQDLGMALHEMKDKPQWVFW